MLGFIYGLLGSTISTVGFFGVVYNVNLCRVLKALRAFSPPIPSSTFSEIINKL